MLLLQIYYVCGLTMIQCMAAEEGVLGVKYSHPSFENSKLYQGACSSLAYLHMLLSIAIQCQIMSDQL